MVLTSIINEKVLFCKAFFANICNFRILLLDEFSFLRYTVVIENKNWEYLL